jgi:5,5'-dehydrodivanillate O-demethylase
MLEGATNDTLSAVGTGTPMGELMRRYWHPIAAVGELDDQPTKPIRLMGEDLVLYKDLSGDYGLIDRHCPHRRADLSYGYVEAEGLRCNYHGWLFGGDGRCLGQPFEDTADPDSRFKDKVRITAYPVEAKAGLLWAYLGPEPAPLVPTWEPFLWENGFVQIVMSEIPCNWFQCQENSIDPVHFEWMHANWRVRLAGETGPYAPTHLKVAFEEFDYGITYKRVRADTDENNPLWTVGRNCLWPNALFTGDHFEWRVPVDDDTTLSVGWFFNAVPLDKRPFRQNRIPYWHGPIKDAETGRWITSHVMNQDFVAWVGQGTQADRTQEHLGRSDRGVIMMRKRFLDDLERIGRGEDPKAVVRDEAVNRRIELPIFDRDYLIDGPTRAEAEDPNHPRANSTLRFVFQAGQPKEIRAAYVEAMGFPPDPD